MEVRHWNWLPVFLLTASVVGCGGDKDEGEDTGEACVSDCVDPDPDPDGRMDLEESPVVSGEDWQWDWSSTDHNLVLDSEEAFQEFCATRTVANGDLVIQGGGFTSLAALSCLVEVRGNLYIDGSDLALAELPALERIGGDLVTSGLALLETLSFLALEEVGASLELADNLLLGTVFLGALGDVGAHFTSRSGPEFSIRNNPVLVNLDVSQLEQAAGLVEVSSNDLLMQLDLSALQNAGSIRIQDNPALVDLDLGALEESETEIDISDNEALESLAMETLTAWPGDLDLGSNTSLTEAELDSLNAVEGNLTVQNMLLVTLDLTWLETVGGDLLVADNADLAVLNLGNLVSVGGSLSFLRNDALFSGRELILASLTELGNLYLEGYPGGQIEIPLLQTTGEIHLQNSSATLWMANLESCQELVVDQATWFESALDSLETVHGGISITDVGSMSAFQLNSLTTLGEGLVLERIGWLSASLSISAALLPSVGGSLRLVDLADGPTALEQGFGNLGSVGEDLVIQNTVLTTLGANNLDGFSVLQSVGGDVTIADNLALKPSDAPWLVCDVLGLANIGGAATYNGTQLTCN